MCSVRTTKGLVAIGLWYLNQSLKRANWGICNSDAASITRLWTPSQVYDGLLPVKMYLKVSWQWKCWKSKKVLEVAIIDCPCNIWYFKRLTVGAVSNLPPCVCRLVWTLSVMGQMFIGLILALHCLQFLTFAWKQFIYVHPFSVHLLQQVLKP